MKKTAALIPARFKSTRFPGKPLVPLLGKPMIIYVCEATAKAVGPANTYVATDSDQIAQVVREHGYQAVMTSEKCLTGTDRIAEAVEQLDADVVVNVQGDEPMVAPESILKIIEAKLKFPEWVVNGMTRPGAEEDPSSPNMPKVVVNEAHRLLYMSRAAIPSSKAGPLPVSAIWKQLGFYAFSPEQLRAYRRFGRKSYNEQFEDIEILRFLDLNIGVQMIELPSGSLAVDCPEDVAVVEKAMRSLRPRP